MEKINHYHILADLGSGGMGIVYKAFDTVLEREVAVKVMHSHLLKDPHNANRFLREARAAAKLVHPNVVTIYEIGEAECGRYIVMEYVQGVPISQLLIQEAPLDWKRAVGMTIKILMGLSSAHKMGILHRDIKADNILVTPDDEVKILDFGIAKITNKMGMTAAGDILGTVEYMAPEQMLGEELDARCDIYAVGTLLYQMLTKRLPFQGDSAVTLLYQKLNEEPIPPSHYNKSVSPELDEVVLRAIQREKDFRWATADEFIKGMQKLFESGDKKRVIADPELDSVLDSTEEADSSAELHQLRSVFVGRKNEFESFVNLFRLIRQGKGQTLVLQGEAGVGKTTLATRFRRYAENHRAWVLYGACLYQEGMDPYLPYIDALRGFFSKESYGLPEQERRKIKEIVREKVPLLWEFTERFTTSFGQLQAKNAPGNNGQAINLFEGIYLLISLLSEHKPVVLIIDDLQWADESSLRLFHYLARQVAGNRIMQLGISRTDRYDLQRDGKPTMVVEVLRRMNQEGVSKNLTLNRLTREENDKLIDETLANTLFSDEFYHRIYEETNGNPFFVIETLKLLQESGDIYLKDGVWYDHTDLKKLKVPTRVEDVFIRRLSSLNDDEREMLQVASSFGNKFNAAQLAEILEISKINLLKKFQRIERDLQIVSATEDGFQFEHPMLRELLYNEIPPVLRQEYHLMIADQIQRFHRDNLGALVGDVAEHFRRGNNHKKAIPLLYQAGMRAFRLSAYNEARLHFENLLESLQNSGESLPPEADFAELHLKMAICYEEAGRWEESLKSYDKLLKLSEKQDDPKGKIEALIRIGRIYIKIGDWEKALEVWKQCQELMETHNLPSGLSRIYNNIGLIHFQKGDLDLALEYFQRTIRQADAGDGAYDRAHALSNRGVIFNVRKQYEQAILSYEEALDIYKARGNQIGEAQIYHNLGITYSDQGRWQEAIDAFQKCYEMADSIENKGLIALTHLNMSKAYLRQGQFKQAREFADKARKYFKRISDPLNLAEVYYVYGLILTSENKYKEAEKFFQESIRINQEKEYLEGYAEACEGYAELCRIRGNLEEAEIWFGNALDALKKMDLKEKIDSIEQKITVLYQTAEVSTGETKSYA